MVNILKAMIFIQYIDLVIFYVKFHPHRAEWRGKMKERPPISGQLILTCENWVLHFQEFCELGVSMVIINIKYINSQMENYFKKKYIKYSKPYLIIILIYCYCLCSWGYLHWLYWYRGYIMWYFATEHLSSTCVTDFTLRAEIGHVGVLHHRLTCFSLLALEK